MFLGIVPVFHGEAKSLTGREWVDQSGSFFMRTGGDDWLTVQRRRR